VVNSIYRDVYFGITLNGDIYAVDNFGDEIIGLDEDLAIEQWSGLKDKNGKMIFEGDILKLIDPKKNNPYGEVYFGSGAFHVKGVDCLWFGSKHGKCEDYEIIGNIMETPELLKS
jgi:hypothetical protein